MQIVIDIPRKMYEQCKRGNWCGNETIGKAIQQGMVITKPSDAFYLPSFRLGMARAFEILENEAKRREESEG